MRNMMAAPRARTLTYLIVMSNTLNGRQLGFELSLRADGELKNAAHLNKKLS